MLALAVLPLANVSFFWWLLSEIPYFHVATPAGILTLTLGAVALLSGIYAASSRVRRGG